MTVKIQFRRGTASAWTSADPILSAGEPGFETDTGKFKVGDGALSWTALPYAAGLESLRLQDLTNVSSTAPTDGQVLTWNNGASTWAPADPTGGGGGGAVNIDDLLDVNIVAPVTTGEVLKWDGTFWTNQADATGAGGNTLTNGSFTFTLNALGRIELAEDAEGKARIQGGGTSYPWIIAGAGDNGGPEISWVSVSSGANTGGGTPGAGDIFDTGTTLNTMYINGNGLTVRLDANNPGYQNWQFNTDGTTDFPGFTMPATDGAAGEVLTTDGLGNVSWAAPAGGGFSRGTAFASTGNIADAASADAVITGHKSYVLLKIQTSHAAWVRLYTDVASRTADSGRAEGVDPSPGAGVIAEVITTGAETILISPATIGFNNETVPTTDIPIRVTNKSGGSADITVTVTILQLEV